MVQLSLSSGVSLWTKGEGHSKGTVSYGVQKGAKNTRNALCIIGHLLHVFLKFKIRILFALAVLYFQVLLYIREMPPYELLHKTFRLPVALREPPKRPGYRSYLLAAMWRKIRVSQTFSGIQAGSHNIYVYIPRRKSTPSFRFRSSIEHTSSTCHSEDITTCRFFVFVFVIFRLVKIFGKCGSP